jgi:methylglutaconyl-CoA hydratase
VFTHKVSPKAIRTTLKLIRNVAEKTVSQSLDDAIRLNAEARMTDDCKRGIEAYLKKEKIVW